VIATESKFDLVDLNEAAALAGETPAGFLAAAQRGEMPPPASRWQRDGRGMWRGRQRWQRGAVAAAAANRALARWGRSPP
jgi:hypothetical protein